ncbi:MAG: hypothetical protein HY763_01545 [Planctomycetes bacterium]|nr:hypothetical protein [Planctomycetota bacterium]
MIPPFNNAGVSPPGVHTATLAEVEGRFGHQSELRRVQMDSVRWMVDLATPAGVGRIVLNGSSVTAIMEPNDVDCVPRFRPSSRRDREAFKELRVGLPFLDIAIVGPRRFEQYVTRLFAADRHGEAKGMVEVAA